MTDNYRTWWSYVPHFIGTPGYVYAYAYGQLLALSVYARYLEEGEAFVPRYLEHARAPAARAAPRSSPRSPASTSPTRGSGTAAWSSCARQLEEAEAAAAARALNAPATLEVVVTCSTNAGSRPRHRLEPSTRSRRAAEDAPRGAAACSAARVLAALLAIAPRARRPAPAAQAQAAHHEGHDARLDRRLQPDLGLEVRASAS